MNIYGYRNYKKLIRDILKIRNVRGERSRLAEALSCHSAFVSQVLNGDSQFSLEQIERISRFFGFSKDQTQFMFLLLQFDRAGTMELKNHFQEQLEKAETKQFELQNRLEFKKTLNREDQIRFYSSWHFGAIHVLVSVPGCHNEAGIANYLGLSTSRVSEVLQFLLSVGLVERTGNSYKIGVGRIHLDKNSPMINKHHTNWKIRAIQAMDQVNDKNLHYSSVVTASKADSAKIREILVSTIEKIRAVVKDSKDEDAFVYSMDFFGLAKND